jgi:hypothetical protein
MVIVVPGEYGESQASLKGLLMHRHLKLVEFDKGNTIYIVILNYLIAFYLMHIPGLYQRTVAPHPNPYQPHPRQGQTPGWDKAGRQISLAREEDKARSNCSAGV